MLQADFLLHEGLLLKTCLTALLVLTVLVADLQAQGPQQAGGPEVDLMWRIVNYWSEWCVPCRREIPVLNELNAQLAASGSNVTVVGVDFDENPRDEALAIALRMGIEFPTLTIDMIRQLQMTAPNVLPTTYVLSPDNQVVAKMIGEQTKLSLLTQLEELKLAGPPD
jgi:thiol-disulfide isomerase/thioredoxin